jgi:helicase
MAGLLRWQNTRIWRDAPEDWDSTLAATTTLAAGINTPASTVVLAENEFVGEALSFESGLRLVELMKQVDASRTPATSVLALIQVLAEMDGVYTPVMKKGRSESVRVSQVGQRYGLAISRALQRYCRDEIEVWCRCKRAAILWDWIEGTPIDVLESRYTTNPFQGSVGYGDIARIADATRFHLRSAHRILTALFPQHPDFLASLDDVLLRLEFGLPSAALPLSQLPMTLTRGQYLALFSHGCTSALAVRQLSDELLNSCLGPSIAARLKAEEKTMGAA